VRGKVWFHRAGAIFWTLLVVPAWLWWRESLILVIAASFYANIKSDWGAAEAADDRAVMEAIGKIEERLERIERLLSTTPES